MPAGLQLSCLSGSVGNLHGAHITGASIMIEVLETAQITVEDWIERDNGFSSSHSSWPASFSLLYGADGDGLDDDLGSVVIDGAGTNN